VTIFLTVTKLKKKHLQNYQKIPIVHSDPKRMFCYRMLFLVIDLFKATLKLFHHERTLAAAAPNSTRIC